MRHKHFGKFRLVMKGGQHRIFRDRRNDTIDHGHCRRNVKLVAIYATLTKELSGSQYPDYRLLALIGQDSHLDLAFLNVEHRVRDIALREHILILLKFQFGLSSSNAREKNPSVKHGFACAHHASLLCRNELRDNEARLGRLHISVRSTRRDSADFGLSATVSRGLRTSSQRALCPDWVVCHERSLSTTVRNCMRDEGGPSRSA